MWVDGQIKVAPCPKQCESFLNHVHEELGPFWGPMDIQFAPDTILVVRDAIANSTICF
jgi:hypothetical protein